MWVDVVVYDGQSVDVGMGLGCRRIESRRSVDEHFHPPCMHIFIYTYIGPPAAARGLPPARRGPHERGDSLRLPGMSLVYA